MSTTHRERTCRRCGVIFLVLTEEDAQSDYCPACRHLLPPPGNIRGQVRWFDRRKGFGFAMTTDGRDVYLSRHQLTPADARQVHRRALLSFRAEKGRHGWQARDVHLLQLIPPE